MSQDFWKSNSPPPRADDGKNSPHHRLGRLDEESQDARNVDSAERREKADADADVSDTQHMKSNDALQRARAQKKMNDDDDVIESRKIAKMSKSGYFKGSKN